MAVVQVPGKSVFRGLDCRNLLVIFDGDYLKEREVFVGSSLPC